MLNRDMYFQNLTVPAGTIVNTNGYRLFVRGSLTLNGTIEDNGGDATNNAPGSGAPAGTLGKGGDGVGEVFGPGLGAASLTESLGGAGGSGGGAIGVSGGAGSGGNVAPPPVAEGGPDPLLALPQAVLGRTLTGQLITGGTGGGSGGECGGSGGYGAGGAGVVVVAAQTVTGGGTVAANGGRGGNDTFPGCGGGGGGGGGGVVVVVSTSTQGGVTLSATGEQGGSGATNDGGAGNPGTALWLS